MARKRNAGEGSIFQRADGRWCAQLDLGLRNGKRSRKYIYAATAADVRDAMTKVRGDLLSGLPIIVEKQNLGQFLERWLEESVKPTVRPLTYEQYVQHTRLYLAPKAQREMDGIKVATYRPLPALGSVSLGKLAPHHVEAFRNQRLKAGLSPRTVQLSLAILRHALDQAVKWGLVPRNVAKLVELPRVKRREIRPFTREQVGAFLAAIKGHRLEAAFVAAVTLGLRRGELLGLRWSDVDFEERTVAVAQALVRTGGKRFGGKGALQFVEPKSANSRRTIPMPETVVAALRAHRARQAGERLAAGLDWKDLGLVFTTRTGGPIEPRALNTEFAGIVSAAKLPMIRLHDLRHSYATMLLAEGVHPRVVMDLLGHSQISLTMNTYSHVLPSTLRDAADKMDRLIADVRLP